jgi:hypothetical protein
MRAERNPNADTWRLPAGYSDLGWQLTRDHAALKACREAGHKRHEFDNSLYRYRCTDVVSTCDECKNVFHTDMSD